MNTSDTELDPTVKDKIFKDKIFPNSGLSQATPQAQPKAILLAGQPGAGKGGLARRAELELDNDLVKIDPDDFHDFYPQVGWYREITRIPGQKRPTATPSIGPGVWWVTR